MSSLVRAGFSPDDPGMRAIGYREFFLQEGCLKKLKSGMRLAEDEAAEVKRNIARDSRRYAKRQETFIKAMGGVIRINAEGLGREKPKPGGEAHIAARFIEEFCGEMDASP